MAQFAASDLLTNALMCPGNSTGIGSADNSPASVPCFGVYGWMAKNTLASVNDSSDNVSGIANCPDSINNTRFDIPHSDSLFLMASIVSV